MKPATASTTPRPLPLPPPFSSAIPGSTERAQAAPPAFGPRLARAAGLVVVAALLHVWVGTLQRRESAVPEAPLPAMVVAMAPLSVAVAAVPRTIPSAIPPPPPAPDRRVVVQTTLVRVAPVAMTGGAADESRMEPRLPEPVGTSGRSPTISAAALVSRPSAFPSGPSAEPVGGEVAAAAAPVVSEPAIPTRAASPPEAAPRPADLKRPIAANAADDEGRQKEVVLAVLGEYRRAYERLDVSATKAVYPTVDDRKLQRAFQELEGQQVRFADCGVSISSSGAGANARCTGDATFRPKVGSRIVRLTNREWTFSLARDGASWQILDARMQ